MWESKKGWSLIQCYLGQQTCVQCSVCSKDCRPHFVCLMKNSSLCYIIKSALRSNIALWNLNDLHSKKSIPARECYDKVDNLYYGFPNQIQGPPAYKFSGMLGGKKKPNRFHSYAITEGCHLQRSPGVQDLRFLDSSLLYTLTTNTFVPYLLENSCAGKKNKKDQWILLLFLAFVSSNYSFEKLLTEVIMSPAYLVTSTQKP